MREKCESIHDVSDANVRLLGCLLHSVESIQSRLGGMRENMRNFDNNGGENERVHSGPLLYEVSG